MREIKTMKQLGLTITPVKSTFRMHARKFLQIVRPVRAQAVDTSGFDTNLAVEGFVERRYTDLVRMNLELRRRTWIFVR